MANAYDDWDYSKFDHMNRIWIDMKMRICISVKMWPFFKNDTGVLRLSNSSNTSLFILWISVEVSGLYQTPVQINFLYLCEQNRAFKKWSIRNAIINDR